MAKGILSQGVVLAYGDGGSPSSFTSIGNVTAFSGPGGAAAIIDATNLDSLAKEKMMGLPDEGQFSVDLNYDPDKVDHAYLRNARKARTRLEFRMTLTDATSATNLVFFGYVTGFALSGKVDQLVTAKVTIEIDGAVSEV